MVWTVGVVVVKDRGVVTERGLVEVDVFVVGLVVGLVVDFVLVLLVVQPGTNFHCVAQSPRHPFSQGV